MNTGVLRDEDSPLLQVYRSGESVARIETVFWNVEREAVPVECPVLLLEFGGRREGSVVVFRDNGERRGNTDRLRWELIHDPLTGLLNGRCFAQLLVQDIGRRREYGGYGALLYFDDDPSSPIVDAGGPAVGEIAWSPISPKPWASACAKATRWRGSKAIASRRC
ncbi:MAG: GGDEF domain-containing protein [Rhodanobacteraceae bacterium]|nr:GGDEF domain-containing protein [Rhodanobacteraceae bacterium]